MAAAAAAVSMRKSDYGQHGCPPPPSARRGGGPQGRAACGALLAAVALGWPLAARGAEEAFLSRELGMHPGQ